MLILLCCCDGMSICVTAYALNLYDQCPLCRHRQNWLEMIYAFWNKFCSDMPEGSNVCLLLNFEIILTGYYNLDDFFFL